MEDKPIYENGVAYVDEKGALRIRINKKMTKVANFNNTDKLRVAYYSIEKKMIIQRLEDLH